MVVAPPAISGLIESAGYLFRPGGEPPEEIVAPTRDRLPNVSAAEASVLGNRELFGRLATQSMLPAMKEACSGWRPDLILREPSEYASAIVASQRGIPVAQVAISFAEAEDGSIRTAAPALENHQRGLTEDLRASPYLTRFPASLDRSPFPTTVRYREPAARPDQPLPDWWSGSDSPLVYVTFGTVVGSMSMAARVYRAALKAVEDLDVRVLLTAGRRFDLSELGPVPANTHVERWVEQSQILAVADLVVCHGGSGTVLGALSAGVPLVTVPLFADQFENSRRIAAMGAGAVVEVDADSPRGSRRQINDEDAPRIAEQIRRGRSAIAWSVRTVVSTSLRSNWLSRRAVGPAMYSRRLLVQGLPLGGQLELVVALDQPLGLEPGERLARGVGVQRPGARKLVPAAPIQTRVAMRKRLGCAGGAALSLSSSAVTTPLGVEGVPARRSGRGGGSVLDSGRARFGRGPAVCTPTCTSAPKRT
jgi:Erythromycin biosynthesis protein CIII-like, C-terminal domain/Erythromycin biosynthesis protein CIII-like, N-terminal domain